MEENYQLKPQSNEYTEEWLDKVQEFQERFLTPLAESTPTKIEKPNTVSNPNKQVVVPNIKHGTIRNQVYAPPTNITRLDYLFAVHQQNQYLDYKHFVTLDNHWIKTLDYSHHLNWCHPVLIQALNALKLRYSKPMTLVKGFTPPDVTALNAHNIGMAIDILAENETQLNEIMNAAWATGFPTIVHAGNRSDEMHVHLDICPASSVPIMYDGIYYEGPWSLSRARTR